MRYLKGQCLYVMENIQKEPDTEPFSKFHWSRSRSRSPAKSGRVRNPVCMYIRIQIWLIYWYIYLNFISVLSVFLYFPSPSSRSYNLLFISELLYMPKLCLSFRHPLHIYDCSLCITGQMSPTKAGWGSFLSRHIFWRKKNTLKTYLHMICAVITEEKTHWITNG